MDSAEGYAGGGGVGLRGFANTLQQRIFCKRLIVASVCVREKERKMARGEKALGWCCVSILAGVCLSSRAFVFRYFRALYPGIKYEKSMLPELRCLGRVLICIIRDVYVYL